MTCLSIMLCESEPFFRLNSRPHIADELLGFLIALPDPGGLLKQGHQRHQGVIRSDHASQNTQRERVEVVGQVPVHVVTGSWQYIQYQGHGPAALLYKAGQVEQYPEL